MSTPHTDVRQPLHQILRVTAQAWGLTLPGRPCGAKTLASVSRRLVCRPQAPFFSIAY
jgi:hypothetical protein